MLLDPRVYGDDIRADGNDIEESSCLSRVGRNLELYMLLDPRVYRDDIRADGNDIGIVWSRLRPFFSRLRPFLTSAPIFVHTRAYLCSHTRLYNLTPPPSCLSRVGGNPELYTLLAPRVYGDDKKEMGMT
jgi:hypothetical protein